VTALSRRQFLAAGLGAAGVIATGGLLVDQAWPLIRREDLIPGRAPDAHLVPGAWPTGPDVLTFAAIGDNGSGGRQAMAVAERMAQTYRGAPYGLVSLLGDICYYGRIRDRFQDVFLRPMDPLIDAGVTFELAVGNHDGQLHFSDTSLEEIDDALALLGTPARYYTTTHGPVDFFYLDSSLPSFTGAEGAEQLDWLDSALVASTNQWKVVCLHHPPFSSGYHGPTSWTAEVLPPIMQRRGVDLVLAGHDHHYERTHPIDGTTYVISGGGCKTTRVRATSITAAAKSTLEFLHVDVRGDRLAATAIRPDGGIVDAFELRPRAA
jgi:3',5'-cyclic AMP phosphodiesterase CpdA